ncbi:MAG: OmpA family protein [Actinomycetota bacterium]|nr:OmpA family protein [Actinomycetota bacterium]
MTQAEEVLERFVTALQHADAATALACFAPDGLIVAAHAKGEARFRGRPALADAVTRLLSGFSELRYAPTRRYLTPEQIIEEGTVTAQHTGPFAGAVATGTRVRLNVRLAATSGDDGLLRQLMVWADEGALLVQLGISVSTGAVARAMVAELREGPAETLRVIHGNAPLAEPPAATNSAEARIEPNVARPGNALGPTGLHPAVSAQRDRRGPVRRDRRGPVLAVVALVALATAVAAGVLFLQADRANTSNRAVNEPAAGRASLHPTPGAAPTRLILPPITSPRPSAAPSVQAGKQLVLRSDVLFAGDSASLTATARVAIGRLAAQIRAKNLAGTIQINGYTATVGTADHARALALSIARAFAVAQALQPALAGLSVTLQPQGFGDADPVASNATADGRARNRRVTIVLPTPA